VQVDEAYNNLLAVIEDLLFSLTAATNSRTAAAASKLPSADQLLQADDLNVALWLKLPTKELRALANEPLQILSAHPNTQQQRKQQPRVQHLRAPYDRNGTVHKKADLRTCDDLDAALNTYRSECDIWIIAQWGYKWANCSSVVWLLARWWCGCNGCCSFTAAMLCAGGSELQGARCLVFSELHVSHQQGT
jgi:hypothetical protein